MAIYYKVEITAYSLEPNKVGEDIGRFYQSHHRTPSAVSRRLAELINGKTARAKAVKRMLPHGAGKRYQAVCEVDGLSYRYSLAEFRKEFNL